MGCAQAAGVDKTAAQGLFEQLQRLPELKDARDLRLPDFGAATA
jgi:hypothetical protein